MPQTPDTRNEAETAADESLLKAKFDASPGLRAEFGDNFARYRAYCIAVASGRAKIIRGGARNG